jgi:hypothetical protein
MDRLQPLDRRIFDALKAHARQRWRRHDHLTSGGQTTRPMMTDNLLKAWDQISQPTPTARTMLTRAITMITTTKMTPTAKIMTETTTELSEVIEQSTESPLPLGVH